MINQTERNFLYFATSSCRVSVLHMCKNQVMLLTERARGERAATRTCAGDQKYKNTNEKKWTEV